MLAATELEKTDISFLKPIYRSIILVGRYYRATLSIKNFTFAYRPTFKRSNIGQ